MSYYYKQGPRGGNAKSAPASTQPWPGKRTGTQGLAPVPAQEQCPAPERAELVDTLRWRIDAAFALYQIALAGKRVEVLCSKDSGWGFAAELLSNVLLYIATGAVGSAVGRLAVDAAERAGAEKGVRDAMSALGGATRAAAKERAKHLPTGAAGKAAFLLAMADHAAHARQATNEQLHSSLDGPALLLAVDSYSADYHNPGAYQAAVTSLLARYEASEIELVGRSPEHDPTMRPSDTPHGGRLDVVQFVVAGVPRSALVDQAIIHHRDETGTARPTDRATLASSRFVRWLDEDIAPAAEEAHRARLGDILVIDVDSEELPNSMTGPVLELLTGQRWFHGARERGGVMTRGIGR